MNMKAFSSNVLLITLCMLGTSFAAPVDDNAEDAVLSASKTVAVESCYPTCLQSTPVPTATVVPECDFDAYYESVANSCRYVIDHQHKPIEYSTQTYVYPSAPTSFHCNNGELCVQDVVDPVDQLGDEYNPHVTGPRDASSRKVLENKAIISMQTTKLKLQQAMQEVQRCQAILQVVGVQKYNQDFKECTDKMALLDFNLEWALENMNE